MRKKTKRIQVKRKACFKTKTGKKKCFTITVPKKYKVNPDEMASERIKQSYIKEIKQTLAVIQKYDFEKLSSRELWNLMLLITDLQENLL